MDEESMTRWITRQNHDDSLGMSQLTVVTSHDLDRVTSLEAAVVVSLAFSEQRNVFERTHTFARMASVFASTSVTTAGRSLSNRRPMGSRRHRLMGRAAKSRDGCRCPSFAAGVLPRPARSAACSPRTAFPSTLGVEWLMDHR